jgi:drug/metabolite transporter (DMT)-like permease
MDQTSAPATGTRFFDRPYLLLSLTSLFWAINIVLGRFAAHDIPPLAFAFLRWGGASCCPWPGADCARTGR